MEVSRRGCAPGRRERAGLCRTGATVKEIYKNHGERVEKLYTLRERLIAGLKTIDGVTINGHEDRQNAPQVVSASFEGIKSEVFASMRLRTGEFMCHPVQPAPRTIRE